MWCKQFTSPPHRLGQEERGDSLTMETGRASSEGQWPTCHPESPPFKTQREQLSLLGADKAQEGGPRSAGCCAAMRPPRHPLKLKQKLKGYVWSQHTAMAVELLGTVSPQWFPFPL